MARFASFWHGPALSAYEHLCISSFIKAGHEYFLYTYDPSLKVPEGCELRAATEFYSRDKIFFYQQTATPKVSAFSNMFRYRMVHETGYCWVDTDVLCLSRDIDETPFLFARQDAEFYNVAVLRFPAGHEALRLAAEYCWERREISRWGDLGPRLFTSVVTEYELAGQASPTQSFYPIHWTRSLSLFRPQETDWVRQQIVGAQMLHLWNETFGFHDIDKSVSPPKDSFIWNCMNKGDF